MTTHENDDAFDDTYPYFFAPKGSVHPDSARAWYERGAGHLISSRYEEAILCLIKAIELKPGSALYRPGKALFHYDLGCALYNLDRYEEASHEFAGIVDNDPQLQLESSMLMVNALMLLAWSQEKLGRTDEATNILAPVLERAVEIIYNIGNSWIRSRPVEAVRLLQAAAFLNPAFPGAWYDLACVYALEGNSNAAFDNLEEAIRHGFRDVESLVRDADLRSLRSDPRWNEIVAEINALEEGE